jgi:hypothetical protein
MLTLEQIGAKADGTNSKIDTANSKLDAVDAKAEKRTPISSAPFTISSSGSYYLTQNLVVSTGTAITIAASRVSLDLNGFTITSTSATPNGTGVFVNGDLRDITIQNGSIAGTVTHNGSAFTGGGFQNGISFGGTPSGVRVANVSVSGCGTDGILLPTGGNVSTLVESCTVRTVGRIGIAAVLVRNSAASGCGSSAISSASVVTNCRGESIDGNGISGTIVQNCFRISTNGSGVSSTNAINSHGNSTNGTGISTSNAVFCTASRSGGTALSAVVANGCYATSGTISATHKYNMPQ